MLSSEFPAVSPDAIALLLVAGFSPDEIRAILRAGFAHEQIMALLGRIQLAQHNGTDSLGLTGEQICQLVLAVVARCLYTLPHDPAQEKQRRTEGEIARLLIQCLIGLNVPYTARGGGDLDIVLPKAIIEITPGNKKSLHQLLKYLDPNVARGRQVILYAPHISATYAKQLEAKAIPVVRSLKELFEYLRANGLC